MTPAEIIAARRDAVVLPSDVWKSWFDRLRAGQLPAYQRAALQVTTTLRPLQGLECVDVIRLMSGLDHDVAGVGCPGLLGVPVAGLVEGDISLEPILARKVRGEVLSNADITSFIQAVADNRASDAQVAAFCMAVYLRGMSDDETVALTSAQVDTGETLDLIRQGSRAPVVDKHSTGGVGDKVSLPLAAVLAACGARVPMISGRGLGHTGGTLDKLQAIPGFRVDLSRDEIVDIVGRVGVVITGQTSHLAPSDRRMYAIRDVTATVSSIPLITASILSKKLAEGLDFLLMDVKVGSGAFIPSEEDARTLASSLVGVAQGLGRVRGVGTSGRMFSAHALLTAMDRPLGRMIGNALEVVESIACLRGWGPPDLRTLVVEEAAHILSRVGLASDLEQGRKRASAALSDGSAYARFKVMVQAQGGDVKCVEHPSRLPRAPIHGLFEAPDDGVVCRIDPRALGEMVVSLGGGRQQSSDLVDPAVGLEVLKQVGEVCKKGEPLVRIHAPDAARRDEVMEKLRTAIDVGEVPTPLPLIIGEVGG